MNAVIRKRYGSVQFGLFTPDLPATARDSEPPLYQVMENEKNQRCSAQGNALAACGFTLESMPRRMGKTGARLAGALRQIQRV